MRGAAYWRTSEPERVGLLPRVLCGVAGWSVLALQSWVCPAWEMRAGAAALAVLLAAGALHSRSRLRAVFLGEAVLEALVCASVSIYAALGNPHRLTCPAVALLSAIVFFALARLLGYSDGPDAAGVLAPLRPPSGGLVAGAVADREEDPGRGSGARDHPGRTGEPKGFAQT